MRPRVAGIYEDPVSQIQLTAIPTKFELASGTMRRRVDVTLSIYMKPDGTAQSNKSWTFTENFTMDKKDHLLTKFVG